MGKWSWLMQLLCHAGVTLADLVEAAQHKDTKGQPGSLLLSQAAKAAGVPCSPAQLYFLGLEQVSVYGCCPYHVAHIPPAPTIMTDHCQAFRPESLWSSSGALFGIADYQCI